MPPIPRNADDKRSSDEPSQNPITRSRNVDKQPKCAANQPSHLQQQMTNDRS